MNIKFFNKAVVVSVGMIASLAHATTAPTPITSSFSASTSGNATSHTPVSGGPAGTYSFVARFCNGSAQAFTDLYSTTTVLSNGDSLINRTYDANVPGQPGGPGSSIVAPLSGAYSDDIASSGECVTVPYQIGLANTKSFNFLIDLFGNPYAPEVDQLATTDVSTSGKTYDPTPAAGAPFGIYSFVAQICQTAAPTLTGVYTITDTLSGNDVLLNRTTDGPDAVHPGGPGSILKVATTGQYADGALSTGECVAVPYTIGFTTNTGGHFSFTIDVRAN